MSKINILKQKRIEIIPDIEGLLKEAIYDIISRKRDKIIIKIDYIAINKFPDLINRVNSVINNNDFIDPNNIGIYITTLLNSQLINIQNKSNNVCVNVPCVIERTPELTMLKLDETIVMEKPEYLLMSVGTLSLMKNALSLLEKCSINDRSYHSYQNIPIALTEILDPGIIETVRLGKVKI